MTSATTFGETGRPARSADSRPAESVKEPWRWTPYLFLLPGIALLVVFHVIPIGISIVGALFKQNLMGEARFAGLDNYIGLLRDPAFWNSLWVTLLFNLVINPLQIGLALLLALLTFRPGFGVNLFRAAYFVPMTMSLAAAAMLWNLLLDPNIGIVNAMLKTLGFPAQPFFNSAGTALWAIVGITLWKGVGYWMMFLIAGLQNIPRELYEAARIDGASPFRQFVHVTLPMLKRVLLFVLVADTALNFLLFAPVYLITAGGPAGSTDLLMYRTYKSAYVNLDTGTALATSTIVLMIIAVIAAVEFRMIRVKGE